MAASAPKGTARRDALIELELKAQAKWERLKVFETDAPSEAWEGGKFMVTFPYPYMNGKLHLGHAFSLTKAEFSAAYYRLLGRKVLFPFGFHCTGMPIQAAAYKLKNEYALYGKPLPNFPPSPPEVLTDGMDAELGAISIGWRAPTCTGGKQLRGFKVLVREGGADSEWRARAEVAAAEAVDGQYMCTIDGLTVGAQYAFQVESMVEGADGVKSRVLSKTSDGKKELLLLPSKKDEANQKKGGGDKGPPKGAKSKVVAKTGGLTSQWDILRSMGISAEDCLNFVDPTFWLTYFPPRGMQDLKRFGVGVDWRRSFITTDYNPYYDSFVRWQFHKLRQGNFIAFGKRPSIFSEADNQPCMDHDRDKGEGVNPQEYTAIKMRILEPLPEVLTPLSGKNVFALAGTLRPETMCGQTNAWILPDGEYGAFEVSDSTVYICAARAARNMSFQDIFPEWGKAKQLLTIKGEQLLGAAISSPLTPYERIYLLPLTTISMTKGTAIVTSVPSDSPDDYAAFMDLKNPKKREFYGVKSEWIDPFELIPILETPDLGPLSAKFMCEKLKVQSQKDVEKLKEAHDACYTSGFYKGVMTSGPFVGLPVQEAKVKTKEKMVADGQALTYLEPEGLVTPRSTPDVECVVALVDQWYLKYGEKEWQAKVGKHLEEVLECFNPAVHKLFREALAWLGDWACSRSFGLGTRMPWDDKFLIESLSDSTIYMSYYLVAHLLQGENMFGQETGPAAVRPEQCTEAFWDCVLLGKPYDAALGVDAATIAKMRREVEFWYPMDLRVSGKDLVPNHLTMSLYNHAAVWGEAPQMWPRGFYCNGHVQVDAEKMSKSKGNFITLEGAIKEWGSDATRLTCADAGDGTDNANYNRVVADRTILGLTTELEWLSSTLSGTGKDTKLRDRGAPRVWLDDWFENEMARLVRLTGEGYRTMRFREALKTGFYGMQDARDKYRTGTSAIGALESLVRQWGEWQALVLAPITPHWCEAVWELLGKEGCVVTSRWPTPAKPEQPELTAAGQYLFGVAHTLSTAVVNKDKKKGKGNDGPKPNQANLYVASSFPRWKELVLELLQSYFDPTTNTVDDKVMPMFKTHAELNSFNKGKQVAQFAASVRAEAKERGAAAFALTMPFDEAATLERNRDYLNSSLGLLGIQAVHVYAGYAPEEVPEPEVLTSATPGKPTIHLFHSDTVSTPKPPAAGAGSSSDSAPAGPVAPSVEEMMAYLSKHDVARVLNEAVNDMALQQPDKPFKWLAERLAAHK